MKKDLQKYLLELYYEEHVKNQLSYNQIKEKYDIPRGTWDYHIRKMGGKKNDGRTFRCNDDFFSVIDSEIKAYLLGFFYADGCIHKTGRMQILLKATDDEILKLFQKYICPTAKIRYTNYTSNGVNRKPQACFRFISSQIKEDLFNLGIYEQKTHKDTKVFLNISDNLKRHFIRGYMDGDGTIRWDKVKWKRSLGFVNGNNNILIDIQQYLVTKLELKGFKLREYKNKNPFFTLSTDTRLDIEKISLYLYTDYEFALKRKESVAKEIINYIDNTEVINNVKKLLTP